MKIFMLLFCFTFSLSLVAQNPSSLAFGHDYQVIRPNQKLMRGVLRKSLEKRCQKLLKDPQCREALKDMVTLLNFDLRFLVEKKRPWVIHHFILIAFQNELKTLLRQSETLEFLTALKTQIDLLVPTQPTSFNLWDFTLDYFQDKQKSLQMLAVLFQDITEAKMHLKVFQKMAKSDISQQNIALLSHLIEQLLFIKDILPDNYQKYFYPREIETKLNYGFYHFYVMGYLSLKLEQKYSEDIAKLIPLTLTLSYEFVSNLKSFKYLWVEPKSYTAFEYPYSMRDIYAAYLGVNYFLGTKNVNLTQEELNQAFNFSVNQGMKTLGQ